MDSASVDSEHASSLAASSPSSSDSATAGGGYRGPSVGAAKGFAVLAESAITALDSSRVTGNLGVSGGSVANITGFDAIPVLKFGIDSGAPNTLRTTLTQREVDALVDDIDVRACHTDYANLARDAQGDMTIRPGVTCLNGSKSDLLLQGRITFDAGGDPNAFFVIRSNYTLTVADGTQVVLVNGAQGCGIFWHAQQQVSLGSGVEIFGTVIAGTGITLQPGTALVGRALARTAAVVLERSTITLPLFDVVAAAGTCTHLQ